MWAAAFSCLQQTAADVEIDCEDRKIKKINRKKIGNKRKFWMLAAWILCVCLSAELTGCRIAENILGIPRQETSGGREGAAEQGDGGDIQAEQARQAGVQAGSQTGAQPEGQTRAQQTDAASETEPWARYTFDPLLYPYYGGLTQEEQAVYRQMYYCVSEGNDTLEPCRLVGPESVARIVEALINDQPGLFWLDSSYQYRYIGDYVTEIVLEFNDLADELEINRGRFEAAAEAILAEALQVQGEEPQERLVHDRLLERAVYAEGAAYNQTAYSALVEGRTVCAGYARAFQYLLTQLGLPCYYCTGTAVNSRNGESVTESHAWNIVMLDGEYYNVDPTWNDTVLEELGVIYYGYYNQADDEFLKDHARSESGGQLPPCQGERCTFQAVYGVPAQLGIMDALGMDEGDVLYSLEDYNQRNAELLSEAGTGEYQALYLVFGQSAMEAIRESVETRGYESGFLNRVLSSLGISSYNFLIYLNVRELSGGWYLLAQTTQLYG